MTALSREQALDALREVLPPTAEAERALDAIVARVDALTTALRSIVVQTEAAAWSTHPGYERIYDLARTALLAGRADTEEGVSPPVPESSGR